MKKLLVCFFALALAGVAGAQTSTVPPAAGWERVEAEPIGSVLQVKATTSSATCALEAVTAESLICTKNGKDITFQQADVRRIRKSHRLRSTLVGFGIGAGAGAATGAAVGEPSSFIPRGKAAAALGGAFGVLGALVGAGTDFTRSTIYSTK